MAVLQGTRVAAWDDKHGMETPVFREEGLRGDCRDQTCHDKPVSRPKVGRIMQAVGTFKAGWHCIESVWEEQLDPQVCNSGRKSPCDLGKCCIRG